MLRGGEEIKKERKKERKKVIISILATLFLTACTGAQGPMGPAGPAGATGATGPTGPSGIALIKTYTGTIPSDGSWIVDVPEILGRSDATFVEVYWAYPSSPSIWTLMADGWLDDTTNIGRICAVSWTYGKVYLNYMSAGDLYLIKVFQHN